LAVDAAVCPEVYQDNLLADMLTDGDAVGVHEAVGGSDLFSERVLSRLAFWRFDVCNDIFPLFGEFYLCLREEKHDYGYDEHDYEA